MSEGRKILWVTGAGAPLGAGAYVSVQAGGRIKIPTQTDFWPTLLRFCKSRRDRQTIESFLFRYFTHYSKVPARADAADRAKLLREINVEEVFTFISERVASPSTDAQLKKPFSTVWSTLARQVGSTFRRFNANAQTRNYFRRLARLILSKDGVVSFNYDTVLEDSIPESKWYYGCVDTQHRGWPILKPHGSVNWATVGQGIEVQQSPGEPIIVAPTHLKFVEGLGSAAGYLNQNPAIQGVWAEMERQMKLARVRLVFIGYSFPPADLYFSSVLRTVLAASGRFDAALADAGAAVQLDPTRADAWLALAKVKESLNQPARTGSRTIGERPSLIPHSRRSTSRLWRALRAMESRPGPELKARAFGPTCRRTAGSGCSGALSSAGRSWHGRVLA